MKAGKVYLVGAGPGDAGLITLKGLEALAQADVVVYDRLVNPSLLNHCKQGVQLIYVGKLPDRHILSQEEINSLLVELATSGRVVVRLKGGDPFVFGRGGEEALALKKAGLPLEIVPGITSAIAVPAYAGIPVTHRGLSSTFTVITGHEGEGKINTAIDWDRLAKDPGTLVFLMGVENLPLIVRNLVERGQAVATPAAVVSWGTRPEQQVVLGTLADIVDKTAAAKLSAPAVIIIGQVVGLREQLRWYENLPFFGKRFLVTRARGQAADLSRRLQALGGEVLEYPAIAIEPPLDWGPLEQALNELASFDWIFFTSVNGVEFFFKKLQDRGLDVRAIPLKVQLGAIGPATRQSLEQRGLKVTYVPAEYRAEALALGLGERLRPGQKVLLPRADLARPWLAEYLVQRGLTVTPVTVYRTVASSAAAGSVIESLEQGKLHVLTFTSPSTVNNFFALLKGRDLARLLRGVTIACIGPVTAAAVCDYGLTADVVASEYTIPGLVQALKDYYQRRERDE